LEVFSAVRKIKNNKRKHIKSWKKKAVGKKKKKKKELVVASFLNLSNRTLWNDSTSGRRQSINSCWRSMNELRAVCVSDVTSNVVGAVKEIWANGAFELPFNSLDWGPAIDREDPLADESMTLLHASRNPLRHFNDSCLLMDFRMRFLFRNRDVFLTFSTAEDGLHRAVDCEEEVPRIRRKKNKNKKKEQGERKGGKGRKRGERWFFFKKKKKKKKKKSSRSPPSAAAGFSAPTVASLTGSCSMAELSERKGTVASVAAAASAVAPAGPGSTLDNFAGMDYC